jgi:hypothetical protein
VTGAGVEKPISFLGSPSACARLQIVHTGFARNSKDIWQRSVVWQPLREIVEKLLIVYDWGESFIVLNLLLSPCSTNCF